MATVIFVQGGGDGAYDEDALLAASLRQHLAGDAEVEYPRMPDEGDPDIGRWGPVLAATIADATAPVVLVGHSAGGFQLLQFLAQHAVDAASIHLIATPYPGGDPDWTFDGFELPERLPPGDRTFLYASDDDEIVPFAHRDLWATAIPGARIRTTAAGHQLGNDLRLVADDIRAVLTRA